MTALDQAFIKAYRAESRRPAASPPTDEPQLDPEPAIPQPEGQTATVSLPETHPPAPHMDFAAALDSQVAVIGIFEDEGNAQRCAQRLKDDMNQVFTVRKYP